jgi:hypothetical protein
MSQNLTVESPGSGARRFEALLDELLLLLNRIAAERPMREAEHAEHNKRFRERMDEIWAIIRRSRER